MGVQAAFHNMTGDHPPKVVYCAVTIDGDLRLGSPLQQKQGVHALRQVHADLGILGFTTWFINEHDFHWSELHPELLLELAASGECLGLHDHLDTHFLEDKPAQTIYPFLCTSRQRLDDFFRRAGIHLPLIVHRNGCAHQGLEIYRALALMEYTVLSDVWPGMKWYSRIVPGDDPVQPWVSLDREGDPGAVFTDNRQVPLGTTPWRHDAHNWLETHSRQGRFLQVPITCLPWVDPGRVQAAVETPDRQSFVVIDTHPYNLQDPATGEVSAGLVQEYRDTLQWIRDTYQATFIRLDQIPLILADKPEQDHGTSMPGVFYEDCNRGRLGRTRA